MEREQAKEKFLPLMESVNLMELLPKAFSIEKEAFKITPSEYIKELSMSMEERHKRLHRISSNMKSSNWEYPPEIRIIPHVLIFQRFEVMSTHRLTVEVKNVGKTLLPIRMRCPNSTYFSANFVGPPVYRLAAGLSVEFEVTFTPKEEKDYQHVLVFTSKEETFDIPIVAIGPRAMLDIPDHIIVNPSPVKISTSKFIVVRNIGNAPAVFNFSTQGKHFQATPAKGILVAGDSMLLNISFESSIVAEVTETLQLSLETGEKFQIILHGSAENVSIRLEKSSVVHEDTFMGLKRGKTVRLINNSSSAIKFCWKNNKTAKEDFETVERLKEKYAGLSELEKMKDARVIYYGLSSAEKHKLSCERILQDELRLLDREEFKFSSDIFSIFPESGDVWPKGVVDMIISFAPKEAGTATAEAYLEVSGRDSRLPLRMKGTGLGPNIILNVKKVDIDFIFLCSLHKYEVQVENTGDIPGTIQYIEKPLVFGGKAEVLPLYYYLKPGEVASFFVSFTSNRQGEFTEKFHFIITESGEKSYFVLKGKVISPSLNFDKRMIDFGIAPFGIPVQREVNLHNLSVVPVRFSLRVTPDGDSNSISVEKFAHFTIKPQVPQNPKEFRVDPEESVVEPFSSKKVTVVLTSNKEGRYSKQLVVDLWGAENGSESCTIKYTCKRAVLTVAPKSIVMPSCFINYPYTSMVLVKNNERVPGFFYIAPQDSNSEEPVTLSTSVCQGFLKPGSSVEIDVTIILNTLGKQHFSLNMLTFGYAELEEVCAFRCTCQGPVLSISPTYLNWKEVNLLETVTSEIEITNESPIPAQVTLVMEKGKHLWSVTPVDLAIPPLKTEKITIELYLKDCGNYKGNLRVDVYNGKSSHVALFATGVGYSLVMTPALNHFYFLGTLFSKKTYEFEIVIENMGNKMYSLIWSPNSDYKSVENDSPKQVFKMIPSTMDINALEKNSVFLQANSEYPGNYKQTFYCHGSIASFKSKELLLSYEVSADFVEPSITCDKKHMHFMISNSSEKDNSGTETKIYDTVILTNGTTLPIEIAVSITRPFCLVDEHENYITGHEYCLNGLDTKELKVKFHAEPNDTKISKTYNGKLSVTLKDHFETINILLTGKMSYPNISIQPQVIDFGYLEVGSNSYRDVKMLNMSPLTVYYSIKWDTRKSYVVPVEKAVSFEPFAEEYDEQYPVAEGEAGESEECYVGNQNREDESSQKENLVNASRNLVTPTKPVLKMPEVEISDADLKVALFPITRNYYNCDDQLLEAYKLIQSPDTKNPDTEINFAKFCDITPFYGTLEPHSGQILSVTFSSNSPVQLYVEAVIQVDSGPEEVLIIKAISSEVQFQLSTTELDFGKQLFCETKSQALVLKNLDAMPYSFEAITEIECGCEMQKDFPFGRGMMTVSPSSGTVGPFESVELIVRYHPGVPGKFESEFELQIAHVDPCIIKVKGMGVFPQVYVALPRPEILKLDPEIGYTATASITPDWFVTGSILKSLYHSPNPLKPYRSRESNVGDMLEENSEEEMWEFIRNDLDCLPSEIDIYLAIERVLGYNLIPMDTNSAIFAVYARTIPGFTVPAYDLDFGVCLAGIAVEQQVKIMNFGPLPAVIYGVFDAKMKQKGIFFRLKNRNELKMCSCLSFTVTFHPKRTIYRKKHEKFETVFYFEIYHGPKIPIRIFAEVTYPHVIPSMTTIDFEEVVCGCCKVIYLRLKNPGFVAARWYISSKKKDYVKDDVIQESFVKPEGSMFYLDYYSGTLNPGEYCTVQVFFKPEYGDKFSAALYINVLKGREKIKILLSGSSVEPKLTVSKSVLDFKSTLPFPYKAEKIFSICNPCAFPVEFYFPEFDEQILSEERILRAVILYYEANEILLPVRNPGDTLPVELLDFYNILLEALNAKFIENEREKMLTEKESENFEESTSSMQFNLGEDITGSSQSFAFEKKKKKMKKFSRSKTAMGSSRDSMVAISTSREPSVPPIFEQKSSDEIQELLEEFITNDLNRDFTYDPVQAAIKSVLPPEKEEEYRDGTLIICYGAPHTNSILLANRLALLTKMTVLSIDNIVLTEAAFARCEAGVIVKDLIEQAYNDYVQVKSQELTPYNAWEENEFLLSEYSRYDFDYTFSEIQRKFKALIELREKLIADKWKAGAPSGSKSDTSRKVEKAASAGKLQMDLNAPIANITEALVVDILRYRLTLEVEDGLVIEGLQSVLMTSTTNALISVLKAVGNVKDIIVIFFLNTYEQYHQNLLNLQAEQELLKYYFQEEVLKILEEEPVEVFENLNLSQEDADFFREQFLTRRREALAEFIVKKKGFYEVQRLKREALQKGQSFHMPLNITFDLPTGSEKKEKEKEKESGKKKDAGKSLMTSETESRKSGSETKSAKFVKPPADTVADSFLTFEMDMVEMKAIIDNWDQRLGALVIDSVAEVKTKKGQTPRKADSAALNLPKSRRGIFSWLVDVSKPNNNSFLACSCYLKTTLQGRSKPSESDDWPVTSPQSLSFSVVPLPPKRNINIPQNVFTITATENITLTGEDFYEELYEYPATPTPSNPKLNRSLSSASLKSKSKESRSSRRRKTESRMSVDIRSQKSRKSSFRGMDENQLKPRCILSPGALQSYKVKYYPVETGDWTHDYVINLVNWNAESVVKCVGLCDIPRIDISPYNMFWNSTATGVKTSAFAQEQYCASHFFNFGQIIVSQSNTGKDRVGQPATFTFVNISTLPVDMRIVFGEEGSTYDPSTSEYFFVEPNALWIVPGGKKEVTVTAIPSKVGVICECLMVIIKDNPKVECIKVMFEAAKASVTATPRVLNFEKILLRRQEVRQLVLENENSISLYFVLRGLEELPEFSFSRVDGCILAKESLKLEITYHATEAQMINEQPVEVLVFDSEDLEDVVQELYFGITAEAYDVAVDIIFSSLDTDEIDFGDTRVEREYSVEFSLKNVGKYLLSCRFEIDNETLKNSGNPVLYCAPLDGKLIPGKLFPVTANFQADTEISWKQEPLIKILLMEPTLDDDLIAIIPMQVTARSYFSRYEIRPLEELNFGHIMVGATTTGYIKIENKGHFSLAYYIELFSSSYMLEEKGSAKTRKSSKMSSASKEKMDKGKKGMTTTIKAGIFEISPCTGVVEVDQEVVISATCTPTEVRSYQDKIIIFVNESLPHLKKGTPLTISAEACLPILDLKDYKNIFREHVVCNDESELLCRSKTGPYTIYTMNDNLFSYVNVCVGKAAEARIYLQNAGLIDCSVEVSVASEEVEVQRSSAMDKTPAKGSEYFSVAAEKLIIEPYASGTILLTFKPDALEVYRAKLTITLEMPEGYENVVQVFGLFGNGILPQIEITEPSTRLPEGQALVSFPPTSPGRTSTASIAFSNTGVLDCKVVMELYKPIHPGVFTLFPKPSTEKMLKIWELAKLIDNTVIVSLSPGEVAEFNVMFNPTEMQNYSVLVKLYIVDNPFENWCFKLTGEVFFEEVVIEKIRTSMPFLNGEEAVNDSKLTAPVSPGQYFVNLGDCYVKKKSKVLFRLSNKTEKEYFKFEWEEAQNISISPAVGHLYPNSYKEILLVFQPDEPAELDYTTLSCTLNKILFGNTVGPSWDSRLVQYQRKLKEDVSARSLDKSSSAVGDGGSTGIKEPVHEVIPESSKMLYLNLSGIADYARLTCETTTINFKDTFMFQTRIFPLVLENSGNIPLEYKLLLSSITVWPLRENKKSQVDESLLRHYRSNSRPQSSQPHSRSDSGRLSDSRCGKRTRPATCVVMDFYEITNDNEQPTVQSIEEETPSYFNPFSIENATGRILPREKASCSVKFSPMDINEFKTTIIIQVASLHPECRLSEIEVTASSLMPYCHFDVPESDYLETGRREYSRPGPIGFCPGVPLPADVKTIEIKVLGVGVTIPIKFHGINPTEDDYTFSWVNITQTQPDVIQSFHCSTLDGWIRAGRQQLMTFSFISQKIGITESFWKFRIPKHGVETIFLFVGDVRQPAVCFLSNHLNLKPTLIGCTSTDDITMINHEDKAFDFSFVPESLYSEGCLNALQVQPRSGKIMPNSEKSIRLIFTGKTPGKTLFNLKCKVKRIKEPFIIPVEVTTYAVQPMITFEDFEGKKNQVELNKENLIDFGSELTPQIPRTITLTLISLSRTSYYYEWEYDENVLEARHCNLQFSVCQGHVASFSKEKCGLTIMFTKKSSLTKFPISLKIRRGPTFYFLISGSASPVTCEFSFSHYDFGYCFLQDKDICFNEAHLILANRSTATILLECNLAENTGFSYVLPQSFIYPLEHMIIAIRFHPKDCILYEAVLTVTMNGNQERMIHLTGHGTEFKVGLADVEDTTISLGAVKVGKESRRKFCLINKSLAVATLLVGFSDQLPVNGEYLARPYETDLDLSQDHRLTGIVTISPSTVFQMRPNETFPVEITFSPHYRSSPFSETVCLQNQEKAEPICLVTGCSLGAEISLDRNFLNFGAVVESCTSDLRLKIVNSGSIGARFLWNTESLTDYSISPTHGCCSAESDVTITVTFCPTEVQDYIKKSVECKFYLSESESYPSQWLSLTGDCVAMPEPKEVVEFQCYVREKDTKEVTIDNTTGNEWQLIPIVSGEYFRGLDVFVVPALSTRVYQVDYCPLTMTEENEFHEGSVFFKPPNGQGLLYQFLGISLPPNPEETIERDVPCKTKYVELLKIKNWLQHPQRFKTNIIFLEDLYDPTCTCTGFEYLEVPSLAQKEYSLNFFAYNVGVKKFQVKFINEESDEYIWYNFIFNVTMCGPLEVINLKSGVRQTCQHEIKLENPLSITVEYKLDVENPEVHYESDSYCVPPEQSIYITVSFTPIHPGEKVVMLNATCSELGVFPRELRLAAIEEVPSNPRMFETPLGTSQTQEFVVTNISTVNATFICKLYSDDFSVNEQGSVEAGQSTTVKVTYEPTEIGSTSATLFVESEQAGNFIFPLLGMSTKPIAKGPFILKPGSAITIPFKNVFNKTKEFQMHVDNQAFAVKTAHEILSSKEECKISVTFQKLKYLERLSEYQDTEIQTEFPMMGQLIVTCMNPFVKWQFYLKGVFEK